MEERRSRCAAVLREVAELSGEALERDHDALLAKGGLYRQLWERESAVKSWKLTA